MSDPILNYRFVIFLPNFIISFTQDVETPLNRKVKTLLLVMYILSYASLIGALILVRASIITSPLPDFPFTMIEHLWKFYLLVPVPATSAILGIVFIRK